MDMRAVEGARRVDDGPHGADEKLMRRRIAEIDRHVARQLCHHLDDRREGGLTVAMVLRMLASQRGEVGTLQSHAVGLARGMDGRQKVGIDLRGVIAGGGREDHRREIVLTADAGDMRVHAPCL